MLPLTFVLMAVVVVSTRANDWAVPCTSGSCGYDWLGDGNQTASSSMMLMGPNQVLSDITPAAGWQVMGCDPNWSSGAHNITMVCSGTPQQMANCNHLYDNGGAENTVVRLPQHCGVGPFARVQSTFKPADQSVPHNITRRDGASSDSSQAVRGLTLDYDFSQVPPSRGTLSLSIVSANSGVNPLTRRHMDILHKRGRGRMLAQRGLFGDLTSAFGDATSAVGNVASDVKSEAQQVTSAVASVATNVASQAESLVSKATSAVQSVASQAAQSLKNLNKTEDTGNIPITLHNSFPLIDATIGCGSNSASLKIDMDAEMDMTVDFGYTIAGSLIPPKLQDVSAHGVMSGDALATFNIQAQAQGSFDTGSLQLFKSGLPGLSVPGIVTLGPEFTISAELQMVDLQLEADMSVTTAFTLPNLNLVFPQSHGKSSGTAQPNGNNTMKLSAGPPRVDVSGSVVAHVIPRLDLGIDLGNGIAKASVFMDVDISGTVGFQIDAGPAANSTTVNPPPNAPAGIDSGNSTINNNDATQNSTATPVSSSASQTGSAESSGNSTVNNAATRNSTSTPVSSSASQSGSARSKSLSVKSTSSGTATSAPKKTQAPKAPHKALKRAESVSGCVNVTGAITVNGGLDGALKPLFNDAITFQIFHTSKELLSKCFGNAAARSAASPAAKRSIHGGSTVARAYRYHEARAGKGAPPAPPKTSSGSTKNEITPQQSKGDKSKLSCSSSTLTPLSALSSLI